MSDGIHIQKAVNAGHIEIAQQINNLYDIDGRKDSCLEDLYITDPAADKKRIEDDKGGLLKDCYEWILENDNFEKWRDDPEQHLLWVKGDPGKGKTMLLAGLITELEKASHSSVFYFFCQAAQPLLRTASYVLRGLIWFIVCKRPGLKPYVRKEYYQASSSVFTDHNAWYALSGILTAILEDQTSADFIIIIDALDECIEGREKLIGYISQCSVSCKAKWIISSRNWPDIESQLDVTESQVRLHLELNHASISNAVLKFVDRKVTQLNSTYKQSTRAQIHKHLLDNANDTFLWVSLVCQELEKPGVKHYHSSSILRRFPAGLNELYERMISDINDRDMEWCRAILAVVAVALRPLSLQELAAADETLTEWIEDNDTLSSLVTSCGSLLTIRGDKVYTVHQSVNDFLTKAPKILPSGVGHQHYSIFNCSMNIMQDRLHRNLYGLKESCVVIDDIAVLPAAPLTIAGYACVYWVDHFCAWLLDETQHQNSLCYNMITQLLEKKYLYWLEAMSLLRYTSKALKAMQRLEDQVDGRAPEKLKPLVNDAVRFAFTHRVIMDIAPLQLYDSALIFTPHLSKIKGCFNQEISRSIDVLSPDFQNWDACLQTIPGIATKVYGCGNCKFSPDGRTIATISTNDDSILLLDASTGALVKSIEFPGRCLDGFIFHQSGDLLGTLSRDGEDETEFSLFHLPNGECSKSFTLCKSRAGSFLSLSPDGKLLALSFGGDTIDIWNIASETKMNSCYTYSGNIQYATWVYIPSHPRALLILGRKDISIWGLDTRHQMSKLISLPGIGTVVAAMTSPDRTCCAVVQGFKELALYSWGASITVQKIARFDPERLVHDVSWVDDCSIALCCDFGIEIWDLKSGRLVAQVQSAEAENICYGINRQLASIGFQNGTLKIWSLDTILSRSEPTVQRSASRTKAIATSPYGKVAVISTNGEFDTLSVAVNARFHHLPKTLENSPPGSYYRSESLAFGHDDYFAVADNNGVIHVFNFDHDAGVYYCEQRIGEHLAAKCVPDIHLTIQFWGQEQILTCDDHVKFWDLKTGKCLRKMSTSRPFGFRRSIITDDGRIAVGVGGSQILIWDIMSGKETHNFDLRDIQLDFNGNSKLSLNSSGVLAVSAWGFRQNFIAIGNAKDGCWVRIYSMLHSGPPLTLLAPKLLDTGFGVLEYDMEHGSSENIPTVTAEDHWDPRYLRLSYTKNEAWLMKGSRKILWIPRQDVDPKRFSIQTDLEAGKSTVTLVHDGCLFILNITIDSI